MRPASHPARPIQAAPGAQPILGSIAFLEDSIDSAEINDILETTAPVLPSGGIDLKDHLCAIEIRLIQRALVEADGTVAEAARLLRIRRTTLVEKLRKYRLSA